MPSVAEQINILPIYVKARGIHDELLQEHLKRVQKFGQTQNITDLFPSAPGTDVKKKSNFGDLSHQGQHMSPSVFLAVIEGPLVDSGGIPGRVAGDLPLRPAAIAIAQREMRLATATECEQWFAEGARRKAEAEKAAKQKAAAKAGRLQELESLRERAALLEKIAALESTIESKKAGAK